MADPRAIAPEGQTHWSGTAQRKVQTIPVILWMHSFPSAGAAARDPKPSSVLILRRAQP